MAETLREVDLLEYRRKWAGYRPYELVKLKGQEMLVEIISWPYRDKDGETWIKARAIGDPMSIRDYRPRKDIALCNWSHHRQKAYKLGFMAGVKYGYDEARHQQKLVGRDG